MLRFLAALAPLLLLFPTGAALAEEAKKDLEMLQGTWEIVEVVSNGNAVPAADLKDGRVVFNGDEMTLKEGSDDTEPRKFRVKLDSSGKPKILDSTALNRDYKGTVTPAIYKLDGDNLTLCSPNDPKSKERPKVFKSEKGSELVLLKLKRAKE